MKSSILLILILLYNIAYILSAYSISIASSGTGFQVTTCRGICCENGVGVLTTPQDCQGKLYIIIIKERMLHFKDFSQILLQLHVLLQL